MSSTVEEPTIDFPVVMVYISMVIGFIGIIAGIGVSIELKTLGMIPITLICSGFTFLLVSAIIKILVDIRERQPIAD